MTANPRTIIITAADDKYFVVVNDLLASIRARSYQHDFDIGLLDVGLGEPSCAHFADLGLRVEKVRSDIDYPGRAAWEAAKPAVRTLTARPFLRNYFPGYDVYIWLDADVWVQTPDAINWMIKSAAATPALHIAPELDRCYKPFFDSADIWQMYNDWYVTNYGQQIANAMLLRPMLNAGVWAMAKDAPVWDAWAKIYTDVLQNLPELTHKSFMADQLALNMAVYMQKLPCIIMPPHFNWLTFFALPMLDRETKLYVEPAMPYRPISQIHLTRPKKLQVETIQCLDGTNIERSLMYSASVL